MAKRGRSVSDWVLATEQGGSTRHFAATALPVRIGGAAGCDIVLADIPGSILIGQLDGVFFVQPGRATENVRLDGELLQGSRRLVDGSVIALDTARLECRLRDGRLSVGIEARVTAGDTAPPDFDALARDRGSEISVSPIAFDPNASRRAGKGNRQVSRTALFVYAAFVVLGTLGWFAFTAKSVRFDLTPVPESFELPSTWFKFRIGDRWLLRAGEHRVVAELPGYYPIDAAVDVGRLPDQTVELEFVRLPGLIAFTTVPEAAAEISLDGEVIGTTPLEDFEVRPGTHQIQFTAERYLTELVTVDVEGGHERQTVTATLTPSWAPVTLTSSPPGANVLVDGRVLATTPAELELTAGERAISVQLAGYNTWQRSIRVVADEPQTLPEVELELADGRVALDTTPVDATISINGDYMGRTPRDLRLRPNVTHRLTLSKPGYETETLEFSLAPDEQETIAIDLKPRLGTVEITTAPAGAEVLVNGELRGVAPLTLELMSVEQDIAVRLDGYAGQERSITPRPGYPQQLPFDLEQLDEATGGGFPRVLTTGSGTRLRLIPASAESFMLGSSRTDPERRSNEVMRRVQLSRAFYLAETELTNAEYRRCDPEHNSGSFERNSLNGDDQPVVNVRVQEVLRCLNQLSIEDGYQPVYEEANGLLVPRRPLRNGYRLPTEAEFAYAARYAGRDGAEPPRFGWGNERQPPDRSANIADLSASDILPNTLVTYTDGYAVSAPVGSFEPNPAGLYDLDGNVAEWMQDFYDPLEEPPAGVVTDPQGPATGRQHVVRGASWRSYEGRQLRLTYRDYEDDPREDIGFRIARSLPGTAEEAE